MTETPLLDPEAIENLRALGTDGSDTFLREIIAIFLSDTPVRLRELDLAMEAGDLARFARAAHSLKGSSSNLGATGLQQAADRLEVRSRESLQGIEPDLANLKAQFQRTKAALDQLCANSPPPAAQR